MKAAGARRRSSPRAPTVSVVIATYNWSSALRCALRSILAQTVQDFEVLVVGDGCTDDSEAVVRSFGDERLRWFNLEANSKSQAAPNNLGLEQARGAWIAYLGHDDIWAPRHLEATLAAAGRAGVECAVGGLVCYGPPGSGWRLVAGFFPDDSPSDEDFVPPSGLMHRRELVERIGPWKHHDDLTLPIDCDFFLRARGAGGIAASGELSVFKFNAAFRRNAYQRRATDEQERMLANLAEDPDFVLHETGRILAARLGGRVSKVTIPDASDWRPGDIHRFNRLAKGVDLRFRPEDLRSLTGPAEFGLEDQPLMSEWHELQTSPRGSFRWTASSPVSTIELPVRPDRAMSIGLRIIAALKPEFLDGLSLAVEGALLDTVVQPRDAGWIVFASFDPERTRPELPYLQIQLCGLKSARPVDLGRFPDKRLVGVAVTGVELAPRGSHSAKPAAN